MLRSCGFACVLAAGLWHVGHAGTLDVYVLAGQSNMSGWGEVTQLVPPLSEPQADVLYHVAGGGFGLLRPTQDDFGPELSFGRTLADHSPAPLGIVKHALGSTSLAVDWEPRVGELYLQLVSRVNHARTYWQGLGFEPRIAGILWMQGEQDAKFAELAESYAAHWVEFLAALRDDLQAADAPALVGVIRGADFRYRDVVRAAQRAVGGLGIAAYPIETDDLTTVEGLHFDTAAQLTLGRRFATAMLGARSDAPGDANGDGQVGIEDLNAVRNNFAGWGAGDVTRDGLIGIDDLNLVRNYFGAGPAATPVPEPSGLALLAIGVLAAFPKRAQFMRVFMRG